MFRLPLRLFLHNRVVQLLLGIALFFNFTIWFLLWWFIPHNAESIFLHYTIYFGVDRVGDWKEIFFLPAEGLFLLLLNTFLSVCIFVRERVGSLLLLGTGILLNLYLLFAGVLLVLLNR